MNTRMEECFSLYVAHACLLYRKHPNPVSAVAFSIIQVALEILSALFSLVECVVKGSSSSSNRVEVSERLFKCFVLTVFSPFLIIFSIGHAIYLGSNTHPILHRSENKFWVLNQRHGDLLRN